MNKYILEIDNLIKKGHGASAIHRLHRLNLSSLDRHHQLQVAQLFRRVGLNHQGLKILNPIVRPSGAKINQSTDEERAEYGVLLINMGVYHEGLILLDEVNVNEVPQALLFKSFGLFSQWDYQKAIPLIEKYIQSTHINEYQKHLGLLNLMAAFVETNQFHLFDENFKILYEYLHKNHYHLLLGNLFEVKVQRHFFEGDIAQARRALEQAGHFLKAAESFSFFLVKKWNYIINLNVNSPEDELLYKKLCKEALSNGFTEGVRDIDLFRFTKFNNESGLKYIFWGTPFASYRGKIKKWSPFNLETSRFKYRPGSKSEFLGEEIDPLLNLILQENPVLLKLLLVFTQDFYRPLKTPEIFSLISPESFYNPFSTPEVVKQWIHRLRQFFKKNKWPFVITSLNGGWTLESLAPGAKNKALLLSSLNRSSTQAERQLVFHRLRLYRLTSKEYTFGELRRESLLSEASFGREIKKALTLGLLSKMGEGKASRYKLIIQR